MYKLTEDAGNGLTRCLGCGTQIGDHDKDCPAHLAFMEPRRLAAMHIALRADLADLRKEYAALMSQLGEYDEIRAKQVRYEIYLNGKLPPFSEPLRGCIADIKAQYPVHAWGLSLTIENIEAMIIERTELRADLARKDALIAALLASIRENSNGCPPPMKGKRPFCKTERGYDGSGGQSDLCARTMKDCWADWEERLLLASQPPAPEEPHNG